MRSCNRAFWLGMLGLSAALLVAEAFRTLVPHALCLSPGLHAIGGVLALAVALFAGRQLGARS